MVTRTMVFNGMNLVFEDEGSGEPLVFLHGSMGSAPYWDVVIPPLLVDHRCLRLEFPGHGRSDRSPAAAYSIEDQADAAIEFLEHEIGPSVVIGASAGAGTAFAVAARRPDLVKAIYSEDAHPWIYTGAWIRTNPFVKLFHLVGAVLRSMPPGSSVAEYAAALGQTMVGTATMFELRGPAVIAFIARFSHLTDPAYFDVVTDPDRFWTDDKVAEVIHGVRCPVHVAYGDIDQGSLVSTATLDALAATTDVSRTHFPGAGHAISPWFPAQSHTDIRSFLARIAH